MKVTLRKKKNKKKISLFIDYYHKGQRRFEYLGLYLYPEPKNNQEAQENKRTMEIADNIYAKRVVQYQGRNYDVRNVLSGNRSFLIFFEVMTESKYGSPGNYGNWTGALRHLKIFANPNITFNDITPEWLISFQDYLKNKAEKKNGEKLLPNSISSYYGKVRAALKEAVRQGIIETSPTARIKAPKEAETQREFLTLEELQEAAKAECEIPMLKKAFIFGCLTGLRFSDLEKLKWTDIQQSKTLGYFIRFQQKKTKAYETLPISDETYNYLEKENATNEFVFPDLTYSAYNNTKLRTWIQSAGINKYITFHCSRHTYATLQLANDTDIYTVSKLLGHKNLQTTQIYAKIIDKKKVEAANKIKLKL